MYPICKTLLLELHHVSLLNLFQVELKQKENRAHKARHLVHQAHMQGTTNKLYPKDSSDVYGKKNLDGPCLCQLASTYSTTLQFKV